MLFTPPVPLLAGRIIFDLDPSPGLVKTRTNFIALCTGEKKSKNAPTKQLHYAQSPIHRVIKGFVAQGGDVTRGDGSGGEVFAAFSYSGPSLTSLQSIFGPKFPCEKAGLQNTPVRGSIAMANSGGKSPTSSSQFFIVLSEDERVAKLKGPEARSLFNCSLRFVYRQICCIWTHKRRRFRGGKGLGKVGSSRQHN